MARLRTAILDDYQRVALTCADWSPIRDQLEIDIYTETIHDEDRLADRLHPYAIICAMRERTKFTASLLDKLPNLKLIATTGMRNAGIDVKHAHKNGVIVSGTGSKGESTLEHIWALLLATARYGKPAFVRGLPNPEMRFVRYITVEDANIKSLHPQWQTTLPLGLTDRTLGIIGVGRLGIKTANVWLF